MQRREAASGLRLPSPASITGFPYIFDTGGNRSGSAKTSQTGFANAGRESGAPLTAGRESPILVLRKDALLESRSLPKTRRGSISVCCGR